MSESTSSASESLEAKRHVENPGQRTTDEVSELIQLKTMFLSGPASSRINPNSDRRPGSHLTQEDLLLIRSEQRQVGEVAEDDQPMHQATKATDMCNKANAAGIATLPQAKCMPPCSYGEDHNFEQIQVGSESVTMRLRTAEEEVQQLRRLLQCQYLEWQADRKALARAIQDAKTSALSQQKAEKLLFDILGQIRCTDRDEMLCVVCLEMPRSATFVHGDSGHYCCCMQCAKRLSVCPICRMPVDMLIRQFDV